MATIEDVMTTEDTTAEVEETEVELSEAEPSGEEESPPPGEEGEVVDESQTKPDDPVNRRFDELEKANKGLLAELTKERFKRQNLEGRFSQINEFLSTIEQRKQEQAQQAGRQEAELQQNQDILAVEFDEDEKPIIKSDRIKDIIRQELAPLQMEIMSSRQQQMYQSQASNIGSLAKNVISEDPSFQTGIGELTGQWEWISRNFDEFVKNGNRPPNNHKEAMEMLYASGINSAFGEQFPDSDFDVVVDAFMTNIPAIIPNKLRKALKMVASKKQPPVNLQKTSSLAQAKALGRKSNFSNAPNSKKSGMDLTSIADLPLENLLSLSDSQAEKLYDLMDAEE
jgi:hypothetical protein